MAKLDDVLQDKFKAKKSIGETFDNFVATLTNAKSNKELKEAKLTLVFIPVIIVSMFIGIYKLSFSEWITGRDIEHEVNVLNIANMRLKEKADRYDFDIAEGINNKIALVNYRLIDRDNLDIDLDTYTIKNYFGGLIEFNSVEDEPQKYIIKSTRIDRGEKCVNYINELKRLKFESAKFNDNELEEYTIKELEEVTITSSRLEILCNQTARKLEVEIKKSII